MPKQAAALARSVGMFKLDEHANRTGGTDQQFCIYHVRGQYIATPAATSGATDAATHGKANYNGTPKYHQVMR